MWGLGILHSFIIGVQQDRLAKVEQQEKTKDPYFAILLSLILPGLGQIYVKDFLAGIIFLGSFFAVKEYLEPVQIKFATILLGGLSSYRATKRIKGMTTEHLKTALLAIALVYGLWFLRRALITASGYAIHYSQTSGASMEPTIKAGDVILVDPIKIARLRRGEIVDCTNPFGRKVIKRLVAFGGETVEIKNGGVCVNGTMLSAPPFNRFCYVSDTSTVFGGTRNPYLVPVDCIYVLGDNSKVSDDSRSYGGVNLDRVYGIVYKVVWPLKDAAPMIPSSK